MKKNMRNTAYAEGNVILRIKDILSIKLNTREVLKDSLIIYLAITSMVLATLIGCGGSFLRTWTKHVWKYSCWGINIITTFESYLKNLNYALKIHYTYLCCTSIVCWMRTRTVIATTTARTRNNLIRSARISFLFVLNELREKNDSLIY